MTFESCMVGDTVGPHFLSYRWHLQVMFYHRIGHIPWSIGNIILGKIISFEAPAVSLLAFSIL